MSPIGALNINLFASHDLNILYISSIVLSQYCNPIFFITVCINGEFCDSYLHGPCDQYLVENMLLSGAAGSF